MGWNYYGPGRPTREIRKANQAAKRANRAAIAYFKKCKREEEAEKRRKERESAIQMRELKKQEKQRAKMQELELAKYEMQVYENRLDYLLSVHKECGEKWNWFSIRDSQPPRKPQVSNTNELTAELKLSQFKPTLCDKIFRRVKTKKAALVKAVEQARETDILNYDKAVLQYKEDYENWQGLVELSKEVIAANVEAYIDVIDMARPFDDISELGSLIEFDILDTFVMGVTVNVKSEEVIPSEIKTLTKTGKLSVKKMPKTKFYEIYQDYVCACVLRIARELFALLPIQTVLITCIGELFESHTGNSQEQPILSVVIPRKILKTLNFSTLDPSDSMSNFLCRMKFQKTKGFVPIQPIQLSELSDN